MKDSELDELFTALNYVFGEENVIRFPQETTMNGRVVRVMSEKRFGFIKGDDGKDYFFHMQDFSGFFNDLAADVDSGKVVKVTFESAPSLKGPRASDVKRVDNGVITE